MNRYSLPESERVLYEKLQQPFAVYQFVDRRVVTLALSDGLCRLLGYENREDAIRDMDHDMYRDTHPDDVKRIAEEAVRFATEGGEYDVIYRSRIPGSSVYRVIHAHGAHVVTETGVQLAHVWYTDEGMYSGNTGTAETRLSARMNTVLREESLLKKSRFDGLTGLPNLSYFFELAETWKKTLPEKGREAVLLYLDLNGMKHYNHRNGFAKGDRLLRAFARLLADTFSNESCCHVTADRFAAFTAEAGTEETLERFFREAEKINGGDTLPVRVGIYSAGMRELPVSAAYDRAKIACDGLRKSRASAFRKFVPEMVEALRRWQYIQENIDRAIAEKWIQVYYQPIVRSVSEKVCDEEALARWIDPTEGRLSPAEFIPQLEDSGQIWKLDLYVLGQVLEKMRVQREAGLHLVPHSVNLSRVDFEMCDITEEIRKRVDASGIPRSMITVEITESVIGSNPDFMRRKISELHSLGFAIWMDDFGSGYSSLDVLQSIPFDLIKFDMSFMRRLNEDGNGKIILTELVKMVTALGLDTVCEGVETLEQVRFLQEIGCSKLQGYYFCRPVSYGQILERYRKGEQIGFEDPATSAYYETVSRVNLYDLGVIASEQEDLVRGAFDTLPMGLIEVRGNEARFVRSNPSYRSFIRRFYRMEIPPAGTAFTRFRSSFMVDLAKNCCGQGTRAFFDETMPDGTVIRSVARRVGVNPVSGVTAVAVAVLSVAEATDAMSYAEIARALAADYYSIYVVEVDSGDFIEYSSPVGRDELAIERHGNRFFEAARQDAVTRICEEDRETFLAWFTRENILRELEARGVFTAVFRLVENNKPVYASMKVSRIRSGNRIILGVNIIDSQVRQQELVTAAQRARDAMAGAMAASEDYLGMYSVDPDTGEYVEFSSTEEYRSLGMVQQGKDFFAECRKQGRRVIFPEDLPDYLEKVTRENILREIRDNGVFSCHYRLLFQGGNRRVFLKVVPFLVGDGKRLLASVRAWHVRQ